MKVALNTNCLCAELVTSLRAAVLRSSSVCQALEHGIIRMTIC